MFFQLRASSAFSSESNSETSFSSDNSSISAIGKPSTGVVHELIVRDLDNISSRNFHYQRPVQREPFRIPRPILTIPRPLIRVPTNHSLWTPSTRPTRIEPIARSSSPSLMTYHTERPFYQNLPVSPPPPPPPPIRPIPIQYQIGPPPSFPRFVPISRVHPAKQKKFAREIPPGLFATLSTGGFQTFAALIYLFLLLALPIIKLVLGILYVTECPVNKNIPLYMIVSGACGLALVLLLLLGSTCSYCRAVVNTKKSTHRLMICIIALARGLQGALAIFLFIWFFFGNIWIFSVRYRVRTDRAYDRNNYCHPTLYSFAFYVLIFTYIYALFTCCLKFCLNFFCCGACDIWRRAFS